MSKYRDRLPQCASDLLFLTDGGLETTLVFHERVELPAFAAFVLLENEKGRDYLRAYFRRYARIALEHGTGFVLESPTWRASADWGEKLGYSPSALEDVNRSAIQLLEELRDDLETAAAPFVLSGCLGPRGDGYSPAEIGTPEDAERYHSVQIETFAASAADLVSAMTITHAEEAIGIARAARKAGLPSVISFTVETDGRLPSGESLEDAIARTDRETDHAPTYYMVNCAHPTHFADALDCEATWLERLGGVRANASRRSHAELDESETLDDGDPVELGEDYLSLLARAPNLNVLGGCCGTDHRHVAEIAKSCAPCYP